MHTEVMDHSVFVDLMKFLLFHTTCLPKVSSCNKCSIFCVTSIYAAWHIGIISSSHFVTLAVAAASVVAHFLFRTISQKWLAGLNSNLACGCNWSLGCVQL